MDEAISTTARMDIVCKALRLSFILASIRADVLRNMNGVALGGQDEFSTTERVCLSAGGLGCARQPMNMLLYF